MSSLRRPTKKYALQGFESGSPRLPAETYPPSTASFRAANKAFDYSGLANRRRPLGDDYIFVKADSKLEKYSPSRICSLAEGVRELRAPSAPVRKKIISHLTLRLLQEKLPAAAFIQPHKSYLVAIDKTASLEGNMPHYWPNIPFPSANTRRTRSWKRSSTANCSSVNMPLIAAAQVH